MDALRRWCEADRRFTRRQSGPGVRPWALFLVIGVIAVASATALAGCGDDDEVQQIDDYEVVVDEATNTLRAVADTCGELRVSTTESGDEVRLTVSRIGDGDCIGSESPIVTLTRPLAGRSIVDDPTGKAVTLVAADGG